MYLFEQYDSNVKVLITFLKIIKVKVNNSTIDETLQNHPDWPSMLCISDSLNKWNVPNGAGKMELNQIDELPVPFIAYTNDSEFPLAIVTKNDDSEIQFLSKNYSKTITKSREDFLKSWTGIYLIAETNEQSGEKEYDRNKRKALINSLIPLSLLVLLTAFSFFFLYTTINKNGNTLLVSATGIYLQYLILFTGVIIASLLLWYEIDKNNPLLKKVCTGITKGNCNAIITGRQSKVFNWLSWSEVGFFYFTGGLLLLMLSGNNINNAITLEGLLNILALPYIVFSVYYQWRVAKQWCVLCLGVQALLLLGGVNILTNNFLSGFPHLPVSFIISEALIYLLPVLLWFAVKPYILHLQEAKNTKREYLRIKFNSEIFETLLRKQKAITIPADGLGIDIGNPDAKNILIKVCNPYCGPCAKAHPKIDKLLEGTDNLKVKIIFTVPNDPEHYIYKPVTHLLAVDEQSNHKEIMRALDDWYLADKKDYDSFATKYPMNGELTKQGDKIEAMDKWCNEMEIQFTTTTFINDYQFLHANRIEDLQYFLAD